MKKIAVGGFLHETNCFVPSTTDFAYFAERGDHPPITRGDEISAEFIGGSYAVCGFLATCVDRYDLIPLVHANGNAGGLILDEASSGLLGN